MSDSGTTMKRLWGLGRILGLLTLLASATAMSAYLLDPYSRLLPWGACLALHVAAWGTVVCAWLHYRRCLRPHSRALLLFFVVLRVFCAIVVSNIAVDVRSTYFACHIPLAVRQYQSLMAAIYADDLAGVKAVLVHDRQPDYVPTYAHRPYASDVDRPLSLAILRGKTAIVAALLDSGAAMQEPGERLSMFEWAAEIGDCSMMHLLLSRGASVNDHQGNSRALWEVVQNGNADEVEFLLRNGANPQTCDPTPGATDRSFSVLHLARSESNMPIAKLLKRAGAKE